jgi:hypothetical protein
MKTFTYSEARQRLAAVLDAAQEEEVLIKRRGGATFSLTCRTEPSSPFDVPGVKTQASTRDILKAIKESRSRQSAPVMRRARQKGRRIARPRSED